MTLVATPGANSANSYVTEAEADIYFENRSHTTDWNDVTDPEAPLITASAMLDWYMDWSGTKASTTQTMEWPRSGVYDRDDNLLAEDTIPARIKQAVFELALSLLGSDRLADGDMDGFSNIKVGPLSLTSDGSNPRTTKKRVIPLHVQKMLSDYVDTPFGSGRLIRG